MSRIPIPFAARFTRCAWLKLLLLALLTLAAQANADVSESIQLTDQEHRLLRAPAEFLVTEEKTDLSDVQQLTFQPLTDKDTNQGISASTYWIRFRLENPSPDHDHAWVIHHETSYLDNLTVFIIDAGRVSQTMELSDRQPFVSRPLDYRKLAFAHTTPAGGVSDIYLRLDYERADSISLNFHLWERQAFEQHVNWEYLMFGGYFGIMLALILIALLFTVVMREATYLYYAIFLAVSSAMWALINGLAYQYLVPDSLFWHNEGFHIAYLLFAIAAFQFSRAFLHTADHFPKTSRVITGLQVSMALAIGLRFLGNYELVLDIAFLSLLSLLFLPVFGWLSYRREMSYARWFAIAWLAYALGLVACLASAYTRLLNWGMEPLIYAQIGGLLEALLLLVALAEQLMGRESDRRQAIQQAHQDPLTRLGNRRLLIQQYKMAKHRFEQSRAPTFFMILDLDHFKSINDTHGHHAGDCILQHLSEVLKRHSGPHDTGIRLGGEEFAILLQAEDQVAALQIAERIRQEFSSNPTRYQGQTISHTLSIGLSPALTADEQLLLEEAMARADEALYRSKAAGRNCTTLSSLDGDEPNLRSEPHLRSTGS